jgi:hypothetical protein
MLANHKTPPNFDADPSLSVDMDQLMLFAAIHSCNNGEQQLWNGNRVAARAPLNEALAFLQLVDHPSRADSKFRVKQMAKRLLAASEQESSPITNNQTDPLPVPASSTDQLASSVTATSSTAAATSTVDSIPIIRYSTRKKSGHP